MLQTTKYVDRSITSSPAPDVIVTGATGFIGRWLVPELTRLGRTVLVLIRNAERKSEDYRNWVQEHGGEPASLVFAEYDLTDSDIFALGPDLSSVQDVFHLAARYEFGLSKQAARQVSVSGSLSLLRQVSELPRLRRFVLVTGYLAGVHAKHIRSLPPGAAAKAIETCYRRKGAYEAAKIEENIALVDEAAKLSVPYTVINPSAVIGDSRSGETTQFIGPGDMVRDLYLGRLPALVGNRNTFVPLVTVDDVARFMARVPDHPEAEGQSYWLLDQDTPKLPDLVELFADHLGLPIPSLIIPKPVVSLLPKAVTGVDPEVLSFITDLAYDTSNAEALAKAMNLDRPSIKPAIAKWLDYLVSKQFGAASHHRPGHFTRVEGCRTFVTGDVARAETVFLHGLPFDSEIWGQVVDQMAGKAARIDLPGLGRNGEFRGTADGWVQSLFRDLKSRPVLVGHSLGCEYALRMATRYPEKFGGVVLVSPFFLQAPAPRYLRWPWLLSTLIKVLGPAKLISAAIGKDNRNSSGVGSAVFSMSRARTPIMFARELRRASMAETRNELRSMLARLHVPAMIIDGEFDRANPGGIDIDVRTIPEAAHNPQISNPDTMAAAIGEFAARVRQTGPRTRVL